MSSCFGILIEQCRCYDCFLLKLLIFIGGAPILVPVWNTISPEPNIILSTSRRVPFARTSIAPKHSTRNIIILQESFRGSDTLHTPPYRLLSHQRRTQRHSPQQVLWLVLPRSDARIPETYQIIAYRGIIAESWLVRYIPVESQRKGVSFRGRLEANAGCWR